MVTTFEGVGSDRAQLDSVRSPDRSTPMVIQGSDMKSDMKSGMKSGMKLDMKKSSTPTVRVAVSSGSSTSRRRAT
ncbi:hypothetical protein ASE01_17500 [Nocardioides sp. Root190]|uniref:hypothetical protein n=1 Tax=Nocardioides sp. Root190 TaxID=1736488 RepID=UPI000701FE41|nr:hypothetical protein [Nocardioides sp. Root190]KRB73815.1 hypothetical protein ASE01_17500 [Nocardioides sp. Root190]